MKARSLRRSRRRSSTASPRGIPKPRRTGTAYVSGRTHSQGSRTTARSRKARRVASPSVVDRKGAVITFRRSTVLRIGVGAVVVAALGAGFAVGLAISSSPFSTPTHRVVTDAATTPGSSQSATGKAEPSPVTAAPLPPTAAACTPGAKPQERPTSIDIGCDGHIAISGVTWSSWGTSTGSGSGTLAVNDCQPTCASGTTKTVPAFVVVSNPMNGIFQDVVITPPPGDMAPLSSSHPGSAWGWG